MKIIAESAYNHNGNLDYLKKLSIEAKNSGSDYFAVQVMDTDSFCDKEYERYQIYKENEFSKKQWESFFKFAKKNHIEVIPCILDESSFNFCLKQGFKLIKLHATDITNIPLLKLIAKSDVKIILETQCATSVEINIALSIIKSNIEAIFSGFSNYPTEVEELNLNVIDQFASKYNFKVGYADHSIDTSIIPCMILSKGADYIEKHITLTRNNRNYDYQVSLYPEEFKIMVLNIKHYSKALGSRFKHPSKSEKFFRPILYKKILKGSDKQIRSNFGSTYIENLINNLKVESSVAAIIARLKSKRLPLKILKPFNNNELIIDLYKRVSKNKNYKTILATSNLIEDDPLTELFNKNNLSVFRGDPISVIDRLLELAIKENAGSIFRVTGDNPFTDPNLMEEMLSLMIKNNLDYVRVNNAPFGIGSELFSTKYLWRLYLKMKKIEFSEYLTWDVLNDDEVKAGSIDLDHNHGLINLSIDYIEDYERCINLLQRIGIKNFESIRLKDIFRQLKNYKSVDKKTEIKLPEGNKILLKDFIDRLNDMNYVTRKLLKIKYE